jgi:dTDP-4-dehydrorhamnose reductase
LANPICVYGYQKVLAEHFISLHSHNYLIIRTTVVYGWEQQGKNFVYRLIKALQAQQPIKVPIDQIGNPTYAPNLAQISVALACSDARGVYHVAGLERVNRYEFAVKTATVFGLDASLIRPVTTQELNQAAPRPLNAGMTVDKITATVNTPLIGYLEGLQMMQKENRL